MIIINLIEFIQVNYLIIVIVKILLLLLLLFQFRLLNSGSSPPWTKRI